MGSCFSCPYAVEEPFASVVSVGGELHRFHLPVTASRVLHFFESSPSQSIFLCNSDMISYDDFIPSVDTETGLDSDRIYFVLPVYQLKHRLTPAEMATLAVKASVALDQAAGGRGRRKARISPALVADERPESDHQIQNESAVGDAIKKAPPAGRGISRSGSLRRMRRYSSRRAKLAVRSFRMRLTTIHEGSVLPYG